jgi:hypothetical protein
MAFLKTSIVSFGSKYFQINEENVLCLMEGVLRFAEGQTGYNGSIKYTVFVNVLPLLHSLVQKEVAFSAWKDSKNSLSHHLWD